MPEQKVDAAEVQTEVWVYGGVRMLDDKRAYAWIDPNGRELLYSKRRGSAIGYRYDAEVRRDDKHVCLIGTPRFIGDPVNEEYRRRLAAQDAAASARLAELARERKAASQDALDEAMRPLVALARGMRTGAERDALIATVLRRLSEVW